MENVSTVGLKMTIFEMLLHKSGEFNQTIPELIADGDQVYAWVIKDSGTDTSASISEFRPN